MYQVTIKKKVGRRLQRLPDRIKKLLYLLVADLQKDGPIQPSWQNFSSLGKNRYHCHLTHHYVACWIYYEDEILIEVYYVGSRENAPY